MIMMMMMMMMRRRRRRKKKRRVIITVARGDGIQGFAAFVRPLVAALLYIYIYIYTYIAEREKAVCLSTEAALESSLQLRAEKAAVLQATQVNVHAN